MKFHIILLSILTSTGLIAEEESSQKKIINQIKDFLKPTKLEKSHIIKESAPYLKVIKGSNKRSTIIYRCKYIKVDSLTNPIESIISSSGSVEKSEAQNIITVNDIDEKIEEIKKVILAIDVTQPQILVEAKIIEVQLNNGMERDIKLEYNEFDALEGLTHTLGGELGAPAQNPLTSQGGGFDFFPYSSIDEDGSYKRLNLMLRWLETTRSAKILSAPNIIVNLNTRASIVTGEDIPIISSQSTNTSVSTSADFRRIGVQLNVTPLVINEDSIELQINPDVSSITRFFTNTTGDTSVSYPVISVRNINTTLTMNDGEVIMLGGLYSSEEIDSIRKTPFLSDLPLLGPLFSSKFTSEVRTQLIFIVKVSVLNANKDNDKIIGVDPEKVADKMHKIGSTLQKSKKIFNPKELGKE